jgi:hypothetical protein
VHLYAQGYTDSKLVDFELALTNSSTIYQQEKISLWSEKIDLADSMKENKMLSEDWIYKNIFNMSDKEIEDQQGKVIKDQESVYRKMKMSEEGEDPAKESKVAPDDDTDQWESSGGDIGRPPEGTKYNTQDHVRGADPLGDKTRKRDYLNRDRTIKHSYAESLKSLTKSMDKNVKATLLSENNLLDDESLQTG